MTLIISNRVREASNTTGTGAFTLAGPALGYKTFFSGIGEGNTTYYSIVAPSGQWEIGLGTLTSGQLVRTTVLDSSSAGAQVDFVAGTKDVFTTVPASEVMLSDRPQTLTNKTIAFATNTLTGVASTSTVQTLTGKTLAFADNTLTGVASTSTAQILTNKTIDFADNTLTGVQSTLVSGTNIKTVNSISLLGSGNVSVGDVTLTGAQTLTNKTISGGVVTGLSSPSSATDAATKGYVDGLDAQNVKLSGAQTVAGVKTFTSPIVGDISGNAATATTATQLAATLGIAGGGTGATTAAAAFTALKQAATETATGVVELATTAEAAAGTDTTRAITPAGLFGGLNATGSAPIYACRAWVNFNGTGTVAIRASGNVSSITDNGTGDYTVNFTTAMPDANYGAVGTGRNDASSGAGTVFIYPSSAPTTGGLRIETGAIAGSLIRSDLPFVNVAIFR